MKPTDKATIGSFVRWFHSAFILEGKETYEILNINTSRSTTGSSEAFYFCMACDASKDRMREAVSAIIGVHCTCPIAVQHLHTCKFHFKK